ncbi:MAG: hypothetical protein AAGI30_13330 [Planctomycetota bacterium]
MSTPQPEPAVMIIHDGGLGALVATLMTIDRSDDVRVIAWAPASGSSLVTPGAPAWAGRVAVLQQQAAVLDLAEVVEPEPLPTSSSDRGAPAWPRSGNVDAARDLLRAIADAEARGCERVIWPIVCGDDLDATYAASELARLVSRIAELDQRRGGPWLDLPLADLTTARLADLAHDLDAPRTETWQQAGADSEAA